MMYHLPFLMMLLICGCKIASSSDYSDVDSQWDYSSLRNGAELLSEYANLNRCAHVNTELFTMKSKCDGFLCWNSQLVQESKRRLAAIYNEFREKVALGYCKKCTQQYANILHMTWNWELEQAAIMTLSTRCPKRSQSYIVDDVRLKQTKNMNCEVSIGIFRQNTKYQTEMLELLPKLLEVNVMRDFDKYSDSFTRAPYSEFGCAYMVTNSGLKTKFSGRLACFYCSMKNSTRRLIVANSSDPAQCPGFSSKSNGRHLCYSKYLTFDLLPCEIKPTCSGEEDEIPSIWKKSLINERTNDWQKLVSPLSSIHLRRYFIRTMSCIFGVICCLFWILFFYVLYENRRKILRKKE